MSQSNIWLPFPSFLQGTSVRLDLLKNSDETEDLQVKYAPKKVFIIKDGGYQELTYEAYCALCESDSSYKDKRFLPLHGMLMEVTEDDYKAFYKARRRQKYLVEQSQDNKDISIDMLATEEFKDREILLDAGQDVADQVVNRILLDKLRAVLPLLDKDDQELIYLHFFLNIPQTKIGRMFGLEQSSISRRINKILQKIKNLMGI